MQVSGEFELNASDKRKRARADLRIALAMRGGVSLAVWIGGAVCEVEALRSATSDSIYGRLRALSNYKSVEVDIMSGASAGGLNGAIYSASLMYGFDFGTMLEVWLELADVESLARSTKAHPGERARPSLFEGENYFRAKFVEKLTTLVESGPPDHLAPPRLDLFLTATRLQPITRTFRDTADNKLVESRSAACFHFHHMGDRGGPLSDFADKPDALISTVPELALAGRSTSSFPVAFEPADVYSAGPQACVPAPPRQPNMFGKFSEHGTTPVIDGGVLDNIPVARAIQAIAGAPASGPAERWLLYLNPSPAEDGTRADTEGLNAILQSLKRAATLKFNTESLSDDLAALSTHNASMAERRTSRATLLAAAAPDLTTDLSMARAAWAGTDARRIVEVLADPDLAFAAHPFVRFAAAPPLESGFEAKRGDRQRFYSCIESATLGTYATATLDAPPLLALGDIVDTLLTIAQQVDPSSASGPEAALYRVRLVVEVLTSVWEQRWVRAATDRTAGPVEPWTGATARALRTASERLTPNIEEAITEDDEAAFHAAVAGIYRATMDEDGSATVDLDELWSFVAAQASELLAGTLPDDPIVRRLAELIVDDAAGPVVGVKRAAVMTAALHRRQLAGESPIRLMRIAGDAPSPLSEWFGLPANPSAKDKLAGAQLANFGAFFSAKWRGNDWMWGRLDAAQGLVDLLADSSRWFAESVSWESVLEELHGIVTSETGDSGWNAHFAAEWEAALDAVTTELIDAAAEPAVAHPLKATRRILLLRIQADLVRCTLPAVSGLDERPTPPLTAPMNPLSVDQTIEQANALGRLGKKIPRDVERWPTIGMRTGLNAWLALRPEGRFLRSILTLVKPLCVFVLGCVIFPRRALVGRSRRFRPADVGAVGHRQREAGLGTARPPLVREVVGSGRRTAVLERAANSRRTRARRIDHDLRLRRLPQVGEVRLEDVVAALRRVGLHCGRTRGRSSLSTRGPPAEHPARGGARGLARRPAMGPPDRGNDHHPHLARVLPALDGGLRVRRQDDRRLVGRGRLPHRPAGLHHLHHLHRSAAQTPRSSLTPALPFRRAIATRHRECLKAENGTRTLPIRDSTEAAPQPQAKTSFWWAAQLIMSASLVTSAVASKT